MTYNNYWLTAGAVMAVHLFSGDNWSRRFFLRGVVITVAFFALPLVLTIASVARGAAPFVLAMIRFARMNQQGYPPEGWSVPWAFLWNAEHGLLLVWGLGLAMLAWFCLRRPTECGRRGALWLGVTVGCYLTMVIFSLGPTKFSVHGRTARQLVPFFSLATACAITGLLRGRRWEHFLNAGGAIATAAQALVNFTPPLLQQFPFEFNRRVVTAFGQVARDTNVKGATEGYLPVFLEATGEENAKDSKYMLLNCQFLSPVLGPKSAPRGKVLLTTSHPLQFRPHMYEGYTPAERAVLASTDISMRVVKVARRPERPLFSSPGSHWPSGGWHSRRYSRWLHERGWQRGHRCRHHQTG